MNDSDDILASFMAVTGGSEESAVQMLEATDFQLQDAIDLFFAVGGNAQQDTGAHHSEQNETNKVRAPIPTKIERLYDPIEVSGSLSEYYHPEGQAGLGAPHRLRTLNAFQSSEARTSGEPERGDRLASMFEPPRGLLFQGSFEEAKAYAVENGRWLILNIQNTAEFASHRLNRDTWRDGGIEALISSSFVLYQVYDVTQEGQLLAEFYHCTQIPAILILDPITGAQMRHWLGFVEPSGLVEALMPFIDTSFNDPGAARLASRRKQSEHAVQWMEEESLNNPDNESDVEVEVKEEKDVKVEEGNGSVEQSPDKHSYRSLPPEPAAPDGCRVAIRLPDGSRIQRRFPNQTLIQSLYDWCVVVSQEAAGGKAFVLSEARPGGQELKDKQETLENAGVKDAMLVMKWI